MNRSPAPPIGERITNAKYGQSLSGDTYAIDGVFFYPFRYGIGQYVRASEDGRIEIFTNHRAAGYRVLVDGQGVMAGASYRFRKFETAARAAIKQRNSGAVPANPPEGGATS